MKKHTNIQCLKKIVNKKSKLTSLDNLLINVSDKYKQNMLYVKKPGINV